MLLFTYISRLQLKIIVVNNPVNLRKFHMRSACWLKLRGADGIPAKDSVLFVGATGHTGGQRGQTPRKAENAPTMIFIFTFYFLAYIFYTAEIRKKNTCFKVKKDKQLD